MDTRESLNKLSIYQLRNKAREAGVKAPTTKLQKQLIEEILLIQSGEQSPFKSNMGRPPKSKRVGEQFSGLLDEPLVRSDINGDYVRLKEASMNTIFEDGILSDLKSSERFEYMGVVRCGDKKNKFVCNYLSGKPYVLLNGIEKVQDGDIVLGKAHAYDDDFGISITGEILSFKKLEGFSKQCKIVEVKTISEMYEFANAQTNVNKIFVEAETNKIFENVKNDMAFHTEDCADISKTYNMMIDVKRAVLKLVQKNEQFCLYLIDIEYIYELLKVYYSAKSMQSEVNAGQYIKELISSIYESECGSVVIFSRSGQPKSSYLDMIINKYCTKE